MVMIEMREAAQERALDLVDELHDLGHQKKMVLCELEDALYDCFETSKDDKEDDSKTDEGTDLGFKSKYRRAMRNFEDDDEYKNGYSTYHRRAMRMRRNRMGRFA